MNFQSSSSLCARVVLSNFAVRISTNLVVVPFLFFPLIAHRPWFLLATASKCIYFFVSSFPQQKEGEIAVIVSTYATKRDILIFANIYKYFNINQSSLYISNSATTKVLENIVQEFWQSQERNFLSFFFLSFFLNFHSQDLPLCHPSEIQLHHRTSCSINQKYSLFFIWKCLNYWALPMIILKLKKNHELNSR